MFPEVEPGEWVYPKKKGFKMACCDCGLVHTMDFMIIKHGKGRRIFFRVDRDQDATAAVRKQMFVRKGKK